MDVRGILPDDAVKGDAGSRGLVELYTGMLTDVKTLPVGGQARGVLLDGELVGAVVDAAETGADVSARGQGAGV